MAIETEVKFRTDATNWHAIIADFKQRHEVFGVENQDNRYYNTTGGELNERKIGLRLRRLEDRSILTIKWDTKDKFKREEIEESYDGLLEQLPENSPALQKLLQDIGCRYEEIIPWVSIATQRTLFHLQQGNTEVEACFDDVTIKGPKREHKLYEIEFELLTGEETELMQIVERFRQQYGDRVELSTVPKLRLALDLVAGE